MSKKAINPSTIIHKTQLVLDSDELPIIWANNLDEEKAQDFTKEIIKLNSDPEVHEIFVYITSYGGDVFSVIAMIEAIRSCSKPVNTVGLGLCASGAGILLAAGTGTRYITPNSFMLIHHIQTGMKNDLPGIEQDVIQTKEVEKKIFGIITERSSMNISELEKKLVENRREWQLSSTKAKRLGFVDVIGMPELKRYIVTEKE